MDFDRHGISVLTYEGDDFHIFGKIFSKQALNIPYVVQPDGEAATIKKAVRRLYNLKIIKKSDYTACKNDTGLFVNNLLIPNNVYPLWKKSKGEGYNFETYMLSLRGGTNAYLEAISEIHGKDVLENYINNRTDLRGKKLTKKIKIVEFVKSKTASKPALAQYVVKKYIKDHENSPVPQLFKRVIKKAITLSK